MGKNSYLDESVDGLAERKQAITCDESFKDIVRYKAISALLVQSIIPEYKALTLVEVARLIVDSRKRNPNMSDADVLDDEVDCINTEVGTGGEKKTLNDFAFKIRKPGSKEGDTELDRIITVNTEMQNSTSGKALGYNVVSRAVYYGASLLRNTVPARDTKYTGIHKVYSIWFCAKYVRFDISNEQLAGGDGELLKTLNDEYIHKLRIHRSYDDIRGKTVEPEHATDLMEIDIIELPRLYDAVDDESREVLYDFFFKIKDIVPTIEHKSGVSLRKAKKGVTDMINYEERLAEAKKGYAEDYEERLAERLAEAKKDYAEDYAERFAEAKERLEREAKAVGMVEVTKDMNRSLTYDKIIETLARKYNWDDELASKMHEHFDNKQ